MLVRAFSGFRHFFVHLLLKPSQSGVDVCEGFKWHSQPTNDLQLGPILGVNYTGGQRYMDDTISHSQFGKVVGKDRKDL